MSRYYVKKPPQHCGHCGGPVSAAGPAPKYGLPRYCRQPDCRAAKARAVRAALAKVADTRSAPTECSACGRPLPPRAWRAGDELGRYCRGRVQCRRKRDEMRAAAKTEEFGEYKKTQDKLLEVATNTIAFLSDALTVPRVECPRCHLKDAVPNWPHLTDPDAEPDGMAKRCDGAGPELAEGEEPKTILAQHVSAVWPDRREYVYPEPPSAMDL